MKRIDKNNSHTYISGPLRRTPLKVASFDFSGIATKRELDAYREYLINTYISNFSVISSRYTSVHLVYRSYAGVVGALLSYLYGTGHNEFYQILRSYAVQYKLWIEERYELWNGDNEEWNTHDEGRFAYMLENLIGDYLALTLVQKIMRQRGHLTFKIPKTLKEKFSWCLLHLYDHMRERGFR